jgi:hypothetical protein
MRSLDMAKLKPGSQPQVFRDIFQDRQIDPRYLVAAIEELEASQGFSWKDLSNHTLAMGLHDRIVSNNTLPAAGKSDPDREMQMLVNKYFEIQDEVERGVRKVPRNWLTDAWHSATDAVLDWTVTASCEGSSKYNPEGKPSSGLHTIASMGCETAVTLAVPEAEMLSLAATPFLELALRKTGNPGDLTYMMCSTLVDHVLGAICSANRQGTAMMGNSKGGWEITAVEK